MMDIHPLKTEQDYDAALQAIEALWEAPEGSPEADSLEILSTWTKVLPQFTLLENQWCISCQTVGESLRPLRTDVGRTHTPTRVANNTL